MNTNAIVTVEQTELPKGKKRRLQLYNFIGAFLISLLICQYYWSPDWSILNELQKENWYKQLSGFLLLLFTTWQWRLAHIRSKGDKKQAKAHMKTHRWSGVIAPLLIFAHSTGIGHAHQTLLLVVFICIVALGIFSYQSVRIKKEWYVTSWTIAHISLATLLPVLILYHAYITYSYS